MAKVKVYDQAPEGFAKADYSYLGKLDAAGWLNKLEWCKHLASEAAKREAGEPTYEEEWKGTPAADVIPRYPGFPTVEAVDETGPEILGSVKKHMLILQLWLPANDPDIMTGVANELRRARERYPSSVKNPGQQALNACIGDLVFARWRNRKIVEISELYNWASREGRRVRNADLGRWLFSNGDYGDPDKAACVALKERQRAFDSIPALWTQVKTKNVTNNSA